MGRGRREGGERGWREDVGREGGWGREGGEGSGDVQQSDVILRNYVTRRSITI